MKTNWGSLCQSQAFGTVLRSSSSSSSSSCRNDALFKSENQPLDEVPVSQMITPVVQVLVDHKIKYSTGYRFSCHSIRMSSYLSCLRTSTSLEHIRARVHSVPKSQDLTPKFWKDKFLRKCDAQLNHKQRWTKIRFNEPFLFDTSRLIVKRTPWNTPPNPPVHQRPQIIQVTCWMMSFWADLYKWFWGCWLRLKPPYIALYFFCLKMLLTCLYSFRPLPVFFFGCDPIPIKWGQTSWRSMSEMLLPSSEYKLQDSTVVGYEVYKCCSI